MEHISKAQIKFIRSLQQKKYRDESGMFVAEGSKCIEELSRSFELVLRVNSSNASATEITQMSGLRTPQGEIAVFKKRATEETSNAPQDNRLVLALDDIQDPGNLGTIIRTCDWYGIEDIYCSLHTADCYNPKVVQATMGALARVRVHYVDLPQWLAANLRSRESEVPSYPIYGTLLDGRNMYKEGAIPNKAQGIIIMGNEGNGISEEVRRFITHPLYIPSYKQSEGEVVESLNVSIATAIILAEFRR
ncbi:MAG: RNA methyltransferase [Paludibacteraceae bacterium]|nr:RNA methyltransferase [Paludibacteraceae bacterium]